MRSLFLFVLVLGLLSLMGCNGKGHGYNGGVPLPYVNKYLVDPVQEGECIRVTVKVPLDYTGYLTLNGDTETAVFVFLIEEEQVEGLPVTVEDVLLCGVNLDALNTLRLELRCNFEDTEFYSSPIGDTLVEEVDLFVEKLPDPPTPPSPVVVINELKITVTGVVCDVQISENGLLLATLIRDGFVVLDLVPGEHNVVIEDCNGIIEKVVIVVHEVVPDPCSLDLTNLPTGGTVVVRTTRLQDVIDSLHMGGKARLNVTTDYVSDNADSYWQITPRDGVGPVEGEAAALIVIELAGFAPGNKFGVYDPFDVNQRVLLFKGSQGATSSVSFMIAENGSVVVDGMDTGTVFSGQRFGFWLDSSMYIGGGLMFSDTSLNVDGKDHMLAYQGDNDVIINPPGDWPAEVFRNDEFILCFEDLNSSTTSKANCVVQPPQVDWDFEDMVILISGIRPRLCD